MRHSVALSVRMPFLLRHSVAVKGVKRGLTPSLCPYVNPYRFNFR